MRRYHKANAGDTGWATSHPVNDMEFTATLSHAEFRASFGAIDQWGEPINLDCAHIQGRVGEVRVGEHDGQLIVAYERADEGDIEVWTGSAVQDMEGYRYESDQYAAK